MKDYWWVAAHPEDGFACGVGADGANMLRLYEELDSELIEDVKQLNEDQDKKGWRAVKVSIEVIDP